MADVNSLADSQLRSLARKIPNEILANLGNAELRVRVETANGLFEDMSRSNDEYERSRLEREAGRVLNAVSLRAWMLGSKHLCDAIDSARRDGGEQAHASALKELDRFVKDNPQPGLDDPAVLQEISGVNAAAPKRRKFFGRNR